MNGSLESALRSILESVLLDVAREVYPKSSSGHASVSQSKTAAERLLLRSSEVAKLLAISERHLHSLTQAGELPCVRVGRLVRYSPHTIQDWIRRTEGNEPEPSRVLNSRVSDQLPRPTKQSAKKKTAVAQRRRPKPKELASPSTADADHTRSEQSKPPQLSKSQPRTVTSFLARRLGVSEDAMPQMTNGELMKIAEVDTPTLHGWQNHNRDMPADAIDKLEKYFKEYLGLEQSSANGIQ